MFDQVSYIRLRFKYPSHHFVFTLTCKKNYTIAVRHELSSFLTISEHNITTQLTFCS